MVLTPCGGDKLPVDIEEDDANDPRVLTVPTYGVVVGHVPSLYTGFKYQ